MRRFNSSALRTLGTTALLVGAAGFAVSVANAASLTLTQVNSGPSAETIPTGDDSTVATFLFPRQVNDTSVATTLSGTLNGTAGANSSLTVQTTGGGGVRNRSIALIPNFGQFDDDGVLHLIANSNAPVLAVDPGSFIFLARSTDLAAIGDTITEMMAFITAGTEGTNYFTLPFTEFPSIDTNVETTEALLNAGISIPYSEFWNANPDGGGPLTNNSYRFNSAFDIFLVAMDTDADGVPEIVTEWGCIQRTGANTSPALAATGNDDAVISEIAILANNQLVDDSGENPADTSAVTLDAATDFLVGTSAAGAGATSLSTFIDSLPGAVNSISSITVTGTGDSDFNRIITLDINPDITDAADIATVRSRFIGFTLGLADGTAGEVNTVAGGLASNSTFAQMGLAGDITIDEVHLLQGSGPNFGGTTRQIWAALDLGGTPTNTGAADPAQFDLVYTNDDGMDIVVANGIAVQAALPDGTQVIGIRDENQDGTADDNVIEEASTRVFVRFDLFDPNDRINSDGTYSDEGGVDIDALEERFALRVEIDAAETPLLGNALGATVDPDSSVDVQDMARPIAAAFLTQATEAGSDFCELVNVVKVVFDETVTLSDAGQFAIAYNDAISISDFSAGLPASLSIPVISTLPADDFEDQILAATAGAITTMFVDNDSLAFTAPEIPVDGEAADGSTSILSGTGDTAYIGGVNVNAVEGAEDLGNTAVGTFSAVEDGDFTAGNSIMDGTPPALVAATASGSTFTAGFSENVFNPSGATEAESFFFINVDGVRIDISAASISPAVPVGNIINLTNVFFDSDATLEIGVFNPGFRIEDLLGNAIDPVIAKNKAVEVTPPAVEFKTTGVAFVDDATNLVTTIVLKTTGEVELNGTEAGVLSRFFVRGDDSGSDNGDFDTLEGLVDSILVGTEERNDGCYLFTLTTTEDCPLPQEDFFVQYSDSVAQEDPADATIVDASNGAEVPSETILVSVARPSTPSPEGNPIGETYVGTIDLGSVTEDALGAEIAAYIFKPISSCGDARFVYKGIVYTGEVAGLNGDGDSLIADGTVLYFHPQLKGQFSGCDGSMEPCGIVNSKPDLDLYQVAELRTADMSGGNGINAAGGSTVYDTQVLLYQNMDTNFVIRPIQLTVRRDTANPGRFTLTGAGISNGTITFDGDFEYIGNTYVTGDADANGTRPYTLHTRGEKNYLGCPVVFVVCPDSNFSDVEPFLANNTLVRRVTFAADNQADVTTGTKSFTFENNRPITFNIDAAAVFAHDLDELEQDDWAFLPASASSPTRVNTVGAGQDFGTAANLPNRLVVPTGVGTATAPFNAVTAFPSGTTAAGFFLMLDEITKRPAFVDINTVLALDTRGVYCGSAGGLNRIASGYAYAVEFDIDTMVTPYSRYTWFTFGTLVQNVSGGTITVTPNATNGGWHLLNNNTGADITASTGAALSGNQIMMSMNDDDGVLIFIEGQPQFSDFEAVPANNGFLIFTDTQFID